MSPSTTVYIAAFAMASSIGLFIGLLMTRGSERVGTRISNLSGRANGTTDPQSVVQFARVALPKIGSSLMPEEESERTKLRSRLVHAGIYHRQALLVFLGFKLLLMTVPAGLALLGIFLGFLPLSKGMIVVCIALLFGMIVPGFWLDSRKGKRQTHFRRALPDMMDVLVICLQGGLSLPAAMKRVAMELKTIHPILAGELFIVDREIQLGRTPGESLAAMADRTGMEEVLSLSSVIAQSDRFGASLVQSLRIHADTLRLKRQQRAEELAQKAGTKILFPTLLLIFPAIFVVILGPAVMQIMNSNILVGGGPP